MATIVDPFGTPNPVYRDPGINVQEIDGGEEAGAATIFALPTRHTILVVRCFFDLEFHSVHGAIQLPPDAASSIGDVVEIHAWRPPGNEHIHGRLTVRDSNGGNLVYQSGAYVGLHAGRNIVRLGKIAANTWRVEVHDN